MEYVQLDLSRIPMDTSPTYLSSVISSLPPKTPLSLVFLDVDGVLNSSAERLATSINEECLKQFCTMVHQTGAHIVVSSTWRKVSRIQDTLQIIHYRVSITEYPHRSL